MKNNLKKTLKSSEKQKIAVGILITSIIHLFLNSIAIIGLLTTISMKDVINETNKKMGAMEVTNSDLIISITFLVIITLAVTLILMQKKIGVFTYIIAEVASFTYTFVVVGFNSKQSISLILPILMGLFIWKNKEDFGFKSKAIKKY